MFTGIIRTVGSVLSLQQRGGDVRLRVGAPGLDLDSVAAGDSIAVNGACLTAVGLEPGSFAADVSRETLDHTTLGSLAEAIYSALDTSFLSSVPLV